MKRWIELPYFPRPGLDDHVSFVALKIEEIATIEELRKDETVIAMRNGLRYAVPLDYQFVREKLAIDA